MKLFMAQNCDFVESGGIISDEFERMIEQHCPDLLAKDNESRAGAQLDCDREA
jgi:hypothetical protein